MGPAAIEDTDFTARLDLTDLPGRASASSTACSSRTSPTRTWSEPVAGSFRTPSAHAARRHPRLVGGHRRAGLGHQPGVGRPAPVRDDAQAAPDVFIHVGDTDLRRPAGPAGGDARRRHRSGATWSRRRSRSSRRRSTTSAAAHLYNLTDEHLRRFNAEVAGGRALGRPRGPRQLVPPEPGRERPPRRQERRHPGGARRGRRSSSTSRCASPADERDRIYRSIPYGPLGRGLRPRHADLPRRELRRTGSRRSTPGRGLPRRRRSCAWLKAALKSSRATWKVVASDMPLGLVVSDGPADFEAVANGDNGAPLGRELEIADLLAFLKRERVRNVVWITGDVHYSRRAPLRSVARAVHRLRSVLGVRGRPAARGHVRARHARRHLRAGGPTSSASRRA